jgi:hypothetical protein
MAEARPDPATVAEALAAVLAALARFAEAQGSLQEARLLAAWHRYRALALEATRGRPTDA